MNSGDMVIIVTMHTEPELAQDALKKGWLVFYSKKNAFDDLLHIHNSPDKIYKDSPMVF